MAWPTEAGSLGFIQAKRRRRPENRYARSHIYGFAGLRGKHYAEFRGKYRIFNAAEYRFYRSNSAPPVEGDSPFATSAALPHEPADTYANGTWFLSASYFNGVIDSGFLPLGPEGQTYLKLVLAAGVEISNPPNPASGVQLEVRAGGVVRVHAFYLQSGSLKADEWSIAYLAGDHEPGGGGPPLEYPNPDAPNYTVGMSGHALQALAYDLPAQTHEKCVSVDIQTRRNDGTAGAPDWQYSSSGQAYTWADAEGPAAAEHIESWPGRLPEDL